MIPVYSRVDDSTRYYKKNEVVFEESINVLKLEVRLRDNALVEYKMKWEKVEKERDQLQQTLEKFQNSSKSLNDLLESQVIDKFKTGLGYSATIAASPAVESFVNLSNKSGSDKGYHSVPPPLTRNFISRKPDLTFMDEIVENENLDVTTVVTPSNEKTVENKEAVLLWMHRLKGGMSMIKNLMQKLLLLVQKLMILLLKLKCTSERSDIAKDKKDKRRRKEEFQSRRSISLGSTCWYKIKQMVKFYMRRKLDIFAEPQRTAEDALAEIPEASCGSGGAHVYCYADRSLHMLAAFGDLEEL
ncbi:hypothetical protein Tco_1314636 [Tanacetum coccineum]